MGIPNFELWAKHWQCTAHPAGFKLPTSWLLEDASVARSTWFWPFRILCMPCMPLPLYLPLFLYLSGYTPCMPICLSCVSLPLFPPCLNCTNALFWLEIWVHAPVCHHPDVCLSVFHLSGYQVQHIVHTSCQLAHHACPALTLVNARSCIVFEVTQGQTSVPRGIPQGNPFIQFVSHHGFLWVGSVV